jgi:hypothetical protein
MTRLLASLWPYRLVRWMLAGVFLWASVVKLADPHAFTEIISDFGLVPESILFATALGLIALEFIAGAGLLFDVRGAVGLAAGLLIVFVGVLSYGIAIGLDIHCGCFGVGSRPVGLHEALWRDLVLFVACGYLWWYRWLRSIAPLSAREWWRRPFSEQGSTEECVP